jgi:hypothetical protein
MIGEYGKKQGMDEKMQKKRENHQGFPHQKSRTIQRVKATQLQGSHLTETYYPANPWQIYDKFIKLSRHLPRTLLCD